MVKLTVRQDEGGRRLDEFLAARLSSVTKMRITRLIAEGGCLIDGVAAESGRRVSSGEHVGIQPFEFVPSSMTPQSMPLEVAFEDDHLIVVVKPAGMLVHPTIGVKVGTLANGLTYHLNRDYFDLRPHLMFDSGALSRLIEAHAEPLAVDEPLIRPGIVHRLDRATSGLLAVAKTPHALSVLSRHFRKGLVRKKYLALVRGAVGAADDAQVVGDSGVDSPEDQGTITAPIGRDPDRRPHWWVLDRGREAHTRFRLLFRFSDSTLIELEPVTGRTNQLRIHCAWKGHPILGDDLYDLPGKHSDDAEGPGRLFLHAFRLAFHHPETGEWKEFSSALPPDLSAYLSGRPGYCGDTVSSALDRAFSQYFEDANRPGNNPGTDLFVK